MSATFAMLLWAAGAMSPACALQVQDPWIRAAPPAAQVMGGFATLHNPGDTPIRVTAASSPSFGRVELHEMRMDGDVMQMRKLDAIEVPAGESIDLAPGALHLMLFDPVNALPEGASAELTLTLDCGASVQTTLPVRAAPVDAGHEHAH